MNKILVVFTEGTDKKVLITSAIYLKDNYGYDILPIYVHDIRRDTIVPPIMDGLMVNLTMDSYIKEKEKIEKVEVEEIEKLLSDNKIETKLIKEFGFPWEIIKEYMKICDTLMIEKREIVSETTITILKEHYKPVILIGEKPLTSMVNIGIASDDGVKVNRSVYSFMGNFPQISNFDILVQHLDREETTKLLDYFDLKDKKYSYAKFEKEDFIEKINTLDLLVMGNLSKSYFFEKMTGRKGLNILENSKVAIYIG